LLLAPSAVFLIGFTYGPVLQVLAGSFTVRGFGTGSHAGWGNYTRLFHDPHFFHAVTNNLIYAAGTIVPALSLALALAVAPARVITFRHAAAYRHSLAAADPSGCGLGAVHFHFPAGRRFVGSLPGTVGTWLD
jgi:ABC-type sugar transport system permease subunit